jgi:hypothetical protein
LAIRYELPSIGKEETCYAQKGPTCWYYAAKMLLKFHQKLEKREDNIVYQQCKELHELRKILTELGQDFEQAAGLAKLRLARKYHDTRAWGAEEVEEEIKKKKAILLECQLDEKTIDTVVNAEELRAKTKRAPDPVLVGRLRNAVEILDKKIGERLGRLELLSNFVPEAGFIAIEAKFTSGDDVEGVLEKFGPFYAGGGLAMRKKVKITEAFLSASAKGSVTFAELEYVNELDPKSAHAIVISGVKGDSLFCVDPNASDKQVEIDFSAFGANVRSAIVLRCEGCQHLALRKRDT